MTDIEEQTRFLVQIIAPKRNETILDIGCGTGKELQYILKTYAPKRVVGLDNSEQLLSQARRKLARFVHQGKAELLFGDAGGKLPFPSNSFHIVFSAEVMECLPTVKRTRLLKEIHRILKPGGRVITEHTDWDTQVWNASDRQLERRLVHAFCDMKQKWMENTDGWMGRQVSGMFRSSSLFHHVNTSVFVLINEQYRSETYGFDRSQDLRALGKPEQNGIKPAAVSRFLRDLVRQQKQGKYFYSVNRYIVRAEKRRG